MPRRSRVVAAAVIACVAGAVPARAAPKPYEPTMAQWRGADGGFASGALSGVVLGADGSLALDRATAASGTDPHGVGGYYGRNFYNGGAFLVGEATSPIVPTTFAYTEAIASWNASTPAGTWMETLVRARVGARWTKWYNLGVWAEAGPTVERHSVNAQGDADGTVAVDTLRLVYKKKDPANAYQVKVRVFTASDTEAPSVGGVTVAASTTPQKPDTAAPGDPSRWGRLVDVPQCSQMVYPDGGTVWCSPTSVSMVLAYWQQDT